MDVQSRFRQIYREKAMRTGGLVIGGRGRGRGTKHCVKRKTTPNGKKCAKYAPGPKPKKGAGECVEKMRAMGHPKSSRGGLKSGGKRGGAHYESKKKAASRSPWIQFVKDFAYENGLTYAAALSDPRTSKAYHSM